MTCMVKAGGNLFQYPGIMAAMWRQVAMMKCHNCTGMQETLSVVG